MGGLALATLQKNIPHTTSQHAFRAFLAGKNTSSVIFPPPTTKTQSFRFTNKEMTLMTMVAMVAIPPIWLLWSAKS
jgi:hypothetical protein